MNRENRMMYGLYCDEVFNVIEFSANELDMSIDNVTGKNIYREVKNIPA
jgi:hypothetical protein